MTTNHSHAQNEKPARRIHRKKAAWGLGSERDAVRRLFKAPALVRIRTRASRHCQRANRLDCIGERPQPCPICPVATKKLSRRKHPLPGENHGPLYVMYGCNLSICNSTQSATSLSSLLHWPAFGGKPQSDFPVAGRFNRHAYRCDIASFLVQNGGNPKKPPAPPPMTWVPAASFVCLRSSAVCVPFVANVYCTAD